MNTFYQDNKGLVKIGSITVILILFIVTIYNQLFAIVQPSYNGLVIKGGALQDKVLKDGFYLKMPFWTSVESIYVGRNSTDESINVDSFRGIEPLSKDGQRMDIDVQLEYSVTNPILFRQETGSIDPRTIENLSLISQVRGFLYDYVAEYTWKGLIQDGERQELRQRLFQTMTTGKVTKRVCADENKVMNETTGIEKIVLGECKIVDNGTTSYSVDRGVSISIVNLRKVKPNDDIIDAVGAAQKKEQEVLIAKQDAEKAKQEAEKVIATKRGETESSKLASEAEAYKVRIASEEKAKGMKALANAEAYKIEVEAKAKIEEAKAQEALKNALSQSADLVQYKKLEIEMIRAQAELEWASNPERSVPNSVTVIGTEEAKGMKVLMGIPNASITE